MGHEESGLKISASLVANIRRWSALLNSSKSSVASDARWPSRRTAPRSQDRPGDAPGRLTQETGQGPWSCERLLLSHWQQVERTFPLFIGVTDSQARGQRVAGGLRSEDLRMPLE